MRLLILCLLFVITGYAQEHNFLLRDKALVWENVFITNETNIPALLSRHPRLAITSTDGKIYKGNGSLVKNTCNGTSAYMANEFSFNFEIEVSSGKYRVSVYNVKFTQQNSAALKNLELFLTEKNELKADQQAKVDIQCLNSYFNRIFSLTQVFKNKQ